MDTRRAVVAFLVVTLLVGVPALAAIANYSVPIQNEVPVSTDQTPTIILAAGSTTDVNMQDMWNGSQLDIRTAQGNITVSGDPGASARLDVTNIEGTQTQVTEISAGSNWINLDPADKNRVDVRGDADTLSFKQIAVDDGATDIQLGGPVGGTAELRLHGLSANTEFGLYDASRDEFLGHFTTDASGTGSTTVDMPDGTQALQVRTVGSVGPPTLSNPSPQGEVTQAPDTLSVDVAANGWPVEVVFKVEGSTVKTVQTSANGTVTADVSSVVTDLGQYNWSVTATDALGQTDTIQTSFQTPDTLTLREEHAPQQIINNSTVTLRFYTVDGEIAIERTTSNGTVNMSGLPNSEFVVFAESPNHYDRRIYINSIFEQENMFLLNKTVFPRANNSAIRSRFVYEDLTGEYPTAETTIQVQRAIDLNGDNRSEYRTVAGDYWGASNEFETILEYGERYRIVLVNQETGARHVAGSHIPTEDLTQTIRVSGLVEEAHNASGIVGLAELNETDDTIDIVYRDPTNATDELQVVVESRDGNDVIYNNTVAGPLGTYGDSVQLNASQAEQDWVVRFESDEHRSVIPVGSGAVGLPVSVPGWLLTLLMSMCVTFVGALYGPRTSLMGAWAMVFVAAGVAMFGWGFSGGAVVVAALVAVGVTLLARARL
jgi:hypothetical protein